MTMVDLQTRQLAANFHAGQDLDRMYQKHNNLKVNLDTIQGAKNPHLVGWCSAVTTTNTWLFAISAGVALKRHSHEHRPLGPMEQQMVPWHR